MAKRAEAAGLHPYRIYEEREEKIVSSEAEKQTRRVARFLKPCALNSSQAVPPSNTPLLCEVFPQRLEEWPSKVVFPGFKKPHKQWEQWIDKLAGKYCTIWNQAGICDAIMSSKFEVCFNKEIVLVLAEFWCSETNTFLFDWGEATVTLEDVMVLGGFSVLGRPAEKPINGLMVEIIEEMEKKKTELTRTPAKKAYHFNWMTHFMNQQEDYKYEHVAFLSLWLARFVFPTLPEDSLGKHVFPIAALLSQGIRVALAPAILAGLFKDLSFLKKQALEGEERVSVSSPFQLLQLWALERFQPVLKSPPKTLKPGQPRAARWHKVNPRVSVPDVRRDVRLPKNFQWRPYAADLTNWQHSSYYQGGKLCFFDKTTDQVLQSYVKCLCVAELVGLEDCKEKYLPHRVSMQFGIDQDLPGDFAEFLKLGGTGNVGFFVPPWSFEPSVTARYSYWWGNLKSARADAIRDDVIVAIIKIKGKSYRAYMKEKNLKMHETSTKALAKPKLQKKVVCAAPEVSGKSSSIAKMHSSATAQFPKKVSKDLSPRPSKGGCIPLPKQRPACMLNASSTSRPTAFVSPQSGNPNEQVKKRKLIKPTEVCRAKKRNTNEYAKNLMNIATKGMKGSNIANIQNDVPFRMEHEHKMRANVSDKAPAKGGKKAMAEGSPKKIMEAGGLKAKQSKIGAVKEVKKTMENANIKTQSDVLLKRIERLEMLLGMK